MELNNESKTLFIPLYGKAVMSEVGLFLTDPKAEEIIAAVDFDFKALKQSKWLSMYMAARAAQIDELCTAYIAAGYDTVLHLGCGLDSRALRVEQGYKRWYDVDFDSVIAVRRAFYVEDSRYKLIGGSVAETGWLDGVEADGRVLVVAEGLTMYLSDEELTSLLSALDEKFDDVALVFDAYTRKAVKASKIKNPVNQMEAAVKWGMDTPADFLKFNANLHFVAVHPIRREEPRLKKWIGPCSKSSIAASCPKRSISYTSLN